MPQTHAAKFSKNDTNTAADLTMVQQFSSLKLLDRC
jgi:hypothetical protein